MTEKLNSYMFVYPFRRSSPPNKLGKSKIRGNIIILISYFDIRIILAPIKEEMQFYHQATAASCYVYSVNRNELQDIQYS